VNQKPVTKRKSVAQEPAAEWVDLSALTSWEKNPRLNDAAVDKVAASIQAFGFGAPIVARRENSEVIAGHTRLKAAAKLGLAKVPVRFLDITAEQAHQLALADNKLGEIASWDKRSLEELLAESPEWDLELLGWKRGELNVFPIESVSERIAPEDFASIDESAIETNCECPRCNFRWKQ
jgi:site-specific DNA-methyltransferase (adenine-specific)